MTREAQPSSRRRIFVSAAAQLRQGEIGLKSREVLKLRRICAGEVFVTVKPKTGNRGEIIAENGSAPAARVVNPSASQEVRRCKGCGVRKVLALGFHRERKGRGGYRARCKKCRNRQRARWARSRYVSKTGRRYRTGAERLAEQGGDVRLIMKEEDDHGN